MITDYTDIISLEPLSIQKYTLVEYMYNRGYYKMPSGWMMKDIITELSDLLSLNKFELRIGGFEFFPIPDKFIMNCKECNRKLYDAIDYFNSYKKADKILNLNCMCYKEYLNQKNYDRLYIERVPVSERICNIMSDIFKDIIA